MLDYLFGYGGYTPHGFCLAWDPRVLWTHIGADLAIAAAYFSIPAGIVVFLRRRPDAALKGPASLFVAFIALCGLTHLMGIVTLWLPLYGLQGAVKAATALVSVGTAIILWRMMPALLVIPARGEIVAANTALEEEMAAREAMMAELAEQDAELARKVDALEAANAELTEFAYAASHDLKSPANTLSLWLDDFAETYFEADAEARAEIDEARAVVARMRVLVEDILDYSRVVNVDHETREPVALDAVFAGTVQALDAEIRAAGAEIRASPLPVVHGHATLLGVLVQNLLSNALKFRAPDRPPVIEVGSAAAGPGEAAFFVRDNGIGIDPAQSERIFRMFHRLHSRADYEGTGLGLALCRRVVLTHGGQIDVASDGATGTTFTITLPQEAAHAGLAA